MPKTDSTKKFGGKTYRYLCWVGNKRAVDDLKQRAKRLGTLMRVTKGKSHTGGPDGYHIWTRPTTAKRGA
jgi:hypothetical protein